MTLSPTRRTLPLCLLLASLVPLLTGCGGNKKEDEALLTPAEASDLIQLVGVMTGADSGGVFAEIQSTFDGTPRTFPVIALEGVPARDTSFVQGSVTWNVRITYNSAHGVPLPVFSDSTETLDVVANAAGHIGVGINNGFFGYVNDTLDVSGLSPTDTVLTYAGFSAADTALLAIPAGAGAQFYFLDNVVEYTAEFDKVSGQGHYPKRGEMRVEILAEQLRSASRADIVKGLPDGVVIVTFDGTENPLAEITTITEHTAAPVYRYHLNLRTGAITP